MRYFLFLSLSVLIYSCSDNEKDRKLEARIAELERKLDNISDPNESNVSKDSIPEQKSGARKKEMPDVDESLERTKPVKVEEPKDTRKNKEAKKTSDPDKDTIYHYYVNGKISVKIHPWKDGHRKIELFDLYGKRTYDTKDIRLSYSRSNHFTFHSNGGVHKIRESFNPGASMYMYENVMEFSTTNEPLVMYKSQWPATLEETMESQIPWFWNKRTGNWEKQELIYEQLTPDEKMR